MPATNKKHIIDLARKFHTETAKNLSSSGNNSLNNNKLTFDAHASTHTLINELFTAIISTRTKIIAQEPGSSIQNQDQIKQRLLAYKEFVNKCERLELTLLSLKNDLTQEKRKEETILLAIEKNVPQPFEQKRTDDEEVVKAKLVIANQVIRVKGELLTKQKETNAAEIARLLEKIETVNRELENLKAKEENHDKELQEEMKELEKIFSELYTQATAKDRELKILLDNAAVYASIGLGLGSVALTAYFIPALLAAAIAIVVGAIPLAIAIVVSFFVFLGNMSAPSVMSSRLLEAVFQIGAYIGVQTYPIAFIAMPFVAMISAVAAVVAFAISAVYAIQSKLIDADKHFEEILSIGLDNIADKTALEAVRPVSVTTNSIFSTTKSNSSEEEAPKIGAGEKNNPGLAST